jgi:glycosyltransferase involved in cell wall biosynthesis
MQAKHLCVSTNEYLPLVGGIQRVVYAQNKWLIRKNYLPFVVTPRIQTPKRYVFDGVNVECFDSMNLGYRLGIPYAIPSLVGIKTFIKAVKSSDIIHSHGHPYPATLILGKLAKYYHKPFVLTQHNTFIEYDNAFDGIERLNDQIVGKEALKEADKIIAVSNATKDYVLSLGAKPKKIKVIHNGVDLARYRPLPDMRLKMRRKLGIKKDARVILTVRRLVYKNGVDTLIDAANLAVQKNPDLVFLVAGKGPCQSMAQAKIRELGIENNVKLTGFVPDEDLPSYYNSADIFVLPSKSGEGLALVALEAMACGLPVIATNVGGIREIVNDRVGKLVPPNMPELLASAILDYAEADLSVMKEEIRWLMERNFGWEKNVEALVETYNELF